ncbi:hypothetical protein [Streptomyces violascens]|uniref:hypothetical protein n=1 Tax=Streptomyces violascens TaxID=67381 RepID=UPI0016767DAC|nr:hypothetical protein [Streptomyces violascens]
MSPFSEEADAPEDFGLRTVVSREGDSAEIVELLRTPRGGLHEEVEHHAVGRLAKAAGLGDGDVLTARTTVAVETLVTEAAESARLWATHDVHGPVDQVADLVAQAHEAAQSDPDQVPRSVAAHTPFATAAVVLLRQALAAHWELGQPPAG